ncbi:MAG TPA: 23S rRNA (uracil(1939)-C(5))-methyltransferase RlmD [Burkholderiales bacterium]|nr:23S rRNA (uracil(1939)-C(5))-methyltransferase RlmD [Burkholderiales bacterium]
MASLDSEGRGVGRLPEGKVAFVEGALPGERATVRIFTRKPRFEVGRATAIAEPSRERREPRCPHFGVCGGCVLQHASAGLQAQAKRDWLEQSLSRIGKVAPQRWLPSVQGDEWGYRRRARLSARCVPKKGGALVGFRERRSTYVADLRECHVLPPQISSLIVPLRGLVETLSIRERLPQIEVAVGDNAAALVFRHLLPLEASDVEKLRDFARAHAVHVWLQPGGPDSAHPLEPAASELYYELPDYGVRLNFRPTDFTQVNHALNRALVGRAIELLDPRPGERIAELFCGLGNFTLPMARRGAEVIGFEGSRELVERARANAAANGLVAQFEARDLFSEGISGFGRFDKLLLDPPRQGAIEVLKALAPPLPRRIVYISCDPATLARDAGVLVHVKGYALAAAGIVDMFPHTAHVESMALFEREEAG